MKSIKNLVSGNKVILDTKVRDHQPSTLAFFSLRFIFGATESYFLKHRQLTIDANSFAAFKQDVICHSTINGVKPVQSLVLCYSQDFLANFFKQQGWRFGEVMQTLFQRQQLQSNSGATYLLSEKLRDFSLRLKVMAQHKVNQEAEWNELMTNCLIQYCLAYQNEIISKSNQLSLIRQDARLEMMEKLALAKEFMLTHYDRDLSICEIASAACLCANNLLKRFKEAYGISPGSYLMKVRLSKARQLLSETSYPIRQIVGMVGFECPSSFSRLFKKNFSTQPLDYRKLMSVN